MRAGALIAVLAAFALGLTGCVSIKLQNAFQRAPGVVTLRVAICASDYDSSHYSTCNASNVAEQDATRFDSDDSSPALGQILVAFRVPDGSTGPGTFLSEAQDVSFSKSASYTQQIGRAPFFPAPGGFHWEGYISTPKTFNPADASTRETTFHAEFTLPPSSSGAPFGSPFRWRAVVGFRSLNNAGEAGNPVDCSQLFVTFCADSPPNATAVNNSLQVPVSDFGVLSGATVTAGQGQTATVTFPISYTDSGAMGPQPLSLNASTSVPGASAISPEHLTRTTGS